MLKRWSDFRRQQRASLRAGHHRTTTQPADALLCRVCRRAGRLRRLGLYRALGQLTQVITLLVVAAFLTLTLNPLVEALGSRGMRRPPSVAIVFAGLVAAFTALGFVVVPPVAQQRGLLADHAPRYLSDLLSNGFLRDLDSQDHVLGKLQAELQKLVTNGNFMSRVFGGVLGASKALASGFFAILTVLVLTLYFLSSCPG